MGASFRALLMREILLAGEKKSERQLASSAKDDLIIGICAQHFVRSYELSQRSMSFL
jgi:hypothetical protein